MESFEVGDQVVLASGSMRMAVEAVEDGRVSCVWCHEGAIGRDTFDVRLLRRWEHREDTRPARTEGGGKPWRGEREGGAKPVHARTDERDDRPPRGKTGWDGKPREKKYFRKG